MKRFFLVIGLLITGFTGNSPEAQTGWIQTQLNANIGYGLFSTDTELFAATYDGVFSTGDDGMPWFSKGPGNRAVYDVIVSHDYILAATVDGIYRSPDSGNNWLPVGGSPAVSGSGGVIGPHLFAKNSSYVFLIVWARGVYRSGDDGESWQQVFVGSDGEGYQDYAAMASCIGVAGETVFIGLTSGVHFPIYFSSDNGNTWAGSQLPLNNGRQDQLLSFHYSEGKLFAGGFMGLYLSTDLGLNWTTQYSGVIDSQGQYSGLGNFRDIVSYDQCLIAAVDFQGIQISRDDGKSWTGYNEGLISDWTFASLAVKPPYVWALRQFFGNAYRLPLADVVTGVTEGDQTPGGFFLYQNHPNPFNPVTVIKYSLGRAGMVRLDVYDILGRNVATLVNAVQSPGSHEVEFNARSLASGIYFYRVTTGSSSMTRKLMVLK